MALSQLQVLSLAGILNSLRGLSTLVPNLQHLYCDDLELGSCSEEEVGSLSYVTTLGACSASGLTPSRARAALPRLATIYQHNRTADGSHCTPRRAALPAAGLGLCVAACAGLPASRAALPV